MFRCVCYGAGTCKSPCAPRLHEEAFCILASPVAQLVKNPSAMWWTWVRSLGWEDPLEKGMATHSRILAWRIHGLYSPWGCKELDTAEWLSLSVWIQLSDVYADILKAEPLHLSRVPMYILTVCFSICASGLRPYHPECARSRLISEAKQGRAWLVLGWEKAERWRIDVFELWSWRRLLRVPWTARRSN